MLCLESSNAASGNMQMQIQRHAFVGRAAASQENRSDNSDNGSLGMQ